MFPSKPTAVQTKDKMYNSLIMRNSMTSSAKAPSMAGSDHSQIDLNEKTNAQQYKMGIPSQSSDGNQSVRSVSDGIDSSRNMPQPNMQSPNPNLMPH